MLSYIPGKFRCIGCISNLSSRALVSAPASNTSNNHNLSRIPHRRHCLVLLKISCSSARCWPWRDSSSSRSDLRIAFLQMDVSKDIADPSGDISHLSASLANLNSKARGLAKVNVDKLESAHTTTGTGTGDLEGGSEQVQVGKSEEDHDVDAPDMNVIGKSEGFNDDRYENRGEIGEEEAGKTETGLVLTPPSSKSAEEAAALDEVLGKISAARAPREQEQDRVEASDVQDFTTEQNLGKTEGIEERKISYKGLEEGAADVGDMVGKAKVRREPGAKLKEDVAKAKAAARNASVGGEIGKTEQEETGKAEIGKFTETEGEEEEKAKEELDGDGVPATRPRVQTNLEENIRKLHASFGAAGHPVIVGRTEGRQVSSVPGTGTGTGVASTGKGQKAEEGANATSDETPHETENLRKLYQSLGSDSYTGVVGKTEGKEFVSTPGSFIDVKAPGKHQERNEFSVDQTEFQRSSTPGKIQEDAGKSAGQSRNAPTKLEENLRKLHQSLGSDSYPGIVGKTEGKEFVSTPGSFIDAKGAGNHEANKSSGGQANIRRDTLEKVKEDVGKAVNQNAPGKIQEDVGKAVNQDVTGKTQEDVGKAVNQDVAGKIQEDIVKGLGQPTNVKHHQQDAGKVEAGDKARTSHQRKAVVEDSADKRRGGGKNEVNTPGMRGQEDVGLVIYLASKGLAEAKYVEKLKYGEGLHLPDGAQVIAAAEVTDGSWIEVFDVNWYLKSLLSYEFGRFVLFSPLVPSTHTLLSQNFHSFPTGTICLAGAQLQGRGRAGNVWQSPKGCLMFSFTIQMTNGRLVPFLQYVVSLAVLEAVEHVCKAGDAPSPDLKIKWPNDLYANGIKVGGVLCTSSYRAKTFNIVAGIGLNVGNREPTTCLDAIIQDLDPQARAIQQEDLLAAIMYKFEGLNTIFQDQGFAPLQDAYYRKWMHSGQSVILEEKKSGTPNVLQVPVTIQGLTNKGFLLATDNEGEQYELHPDGNSFDFLKGLVRQKVSS